MWNSQIDNYNFDCLLIEGKQSFSSAFWIKIYFFFDTNRDDIVQRKNSIQFILLISHDYIIKYFFIDIFRDTYLVFYSLFQRRYYLLGWDKDFKINDEKLLFSLIHREGGIGFIW